MLPFHRLIHLVSSILLPVWIGSIGSRFGGCGSSTYRKSGFNLRTKRFIQVRGIYGVRDTTGPEPISSDGKWALKALALRLIFCAEGGRNLTSATAIDIGRLSVSPLFTPSDPLGPITRPSLVLCIACQLNCCHEIALLLTDNRQLLKPPVAR